MAQGLGSSLGCFVRIYGIHHPQGSMYPSSIYTLAFRGHSHSNLVNIAFLKVPVPVQNETRHGNLRLAGWARYKERYQKFRRVI